MSTRRPGAILRVDGLSKSYGRFAAVREVSFSIRRGEILGFKDFTVSRED